ncbi:MAG: phosphate acetyltransferase [Alphaproteobacteria bacterium]|nr:phosphate acetyltransferase [Alphaproteobacteria bacterium]
MTKYLDSLLNRAAQNVKTIVLPEGEDERILEAAHYVAERKAAKLIIFGNPEEIKAYYAKKNWNMDSISILVPENSPKREEYAKLLYELRKAKGMTPEEAESLAVNYTFHGTLMMKSGDADGMVSGANHSTADTVRPALQIIKSAYKDRSVSSAALMVINDKPYLFSDPAIIINPTEQEMADMALATAETAIQFGLDPKVAMLSYSTYGSGHGETVDKVRNATKLAQQMVENGPLKGKVAVDGELQADAALDEVVAKKKAPGSPVAGKANVLIFPCLEVGNISYKLLQRFYGAEAYGPIMQGLNAPINDLSRGALVEDIVGMIAITAIQAVK